MKILAIILLVGWGSLGWYRLEKKQVSPMDYALLLVSYLSSLLVVVLS